MRRISLIIALAIMVAMGVSCGRSDGWTVKGNVNDAEGKTLILEGSNQGVWYVIDSLRLDASGNFTFNGEPAGYPDIYRLTIDGKSIYFPIDSIETLTIDAKGKSFGADYTISGSELAQDMSNMDNKIIGLVATKGAAATVADTALSRELSELMLKDPSSVLAYYIINKRIGATPLFNPAVKADVRLIGAVANAFATNRPNDPRTKYLTDLYIGSRKALSSRVDTMSVAEVPIIDFTLPDADGKMRNLSSLAGQGKVLLLNFTVYDADPSPAFNLKLNKIYNDLKSRGLEIVQVSVDDDHFEWSRSARNLPWITLFAPENDRAEVLMKYNVTNLPTTFIINRKGEIVRRVDDVDALPKAIEAYL